jgi:broad specificity phosphatase PhoE
MAEPVTGQSPRPPGGPALVLVRHGETAWSRSGQHTGRTDVPLTELGSAQATASGPLIRRLLRGQDPSLVISSPRSRALLTAELAGYQPDEVTEDAAEWDYGDFEGLTSAEIQRDQPDWSIWQGPVPGGEDAGAVTARFDRLLVRAAGPAADGPVLVFSHGHAIRCIAARWLEQPVTAGSYFALGTGAVSSLGYEHARPVILQWNLDTSVLQPTR